MAGLITELKRRNVFRVGVAYLALAWVVIEVTDMAVPALNLPGSLNSIVFYIGVIGFPFALFFAWAFELTPEGLMKTADVDKSQSITHSTGRKLDFAIIGMLAIAVAFLLYDRTAPPPREAAPAATISIAVLPFADMSPGKDQEYFSDGITEELLNTLVKIDGFRVAARTSTFSYKGKMLDVREIGAELGVETIVEGSVRKDGDDLRITAQLVRVADGFHLWSETYDRKLDNVFVIQEEISRAIAAALAVPLGLAPETSLVDNRTTNMQAYEFYLKARGLIRLRNLGLEEAVILLRKVLELDPEFAPAWAALAHAYMIVPDYLSELQGEPVDVSSFRHFAEIAALRAISLNQGQASGHHALGAALLRRGAWAQAEDAFEVAMGLEPQSIDIIEDYSELLIAVGKFEAVLRLAGEAYEREPSSPLAAGTFADALYANGRDDEAHAILMLAIKSNREHAFLQYRVRAGYLRRGDIDGALTFLKSVENPQVKSWVAEFEPVLIALRDGTDVPAFDKAVLFNGSPASTWYAIGGNALVMDGSYYLYGRPSDYWIYPLSRMGAAEDVFRASSHFKQMTLEYGLVDYWRARGWPPFCWPLDHGDFECGAARP